MATTLQVAQHHDTTKVTDVLDGASIPYEIYSQIKANPTVENVQTGVAAFKASG